MLSKNPSFIGHQKQCDFLQHMVDSKRIHQAILFVGERHIGKQSLAARFAYNLLAKQTNICQTPDFSSVLWQHMENNICQNFLYITKDYNKTAEKTAQYITLDSIATLQKFAQYSDKNYKIILIDSIDDLNINATNALLKILEEPPKNTIFLLLSHKTKPILPTVKSRCALLSFSPLSEKDMMLILEKTVENYDETKARWAAQKSQGNVKKALSIYNNETSNIVEELLNKVNLDISQLRSTLNKEDYVNLKSEILDSIASLANKAAFNASISVANKLCLLYKNTQQQLDEVEHYNLDKEQALFNVIVEFYNIKRNYEKS